MMRRPPIPTRTDPLIPSTSLFRSLTAQSGPLPGAVKDPLAPFAQAILVIRWGTTAVSLVLASTGLQDGDRGLLAACCALVAYTVLRTLRPLRFDDRLTGTLLVLAEVAGTLVAITATGYWSSPLVFSMLTAVAVRSEEHPSEL